MNSYDTRKQVECPRCHEQCGWCSDYRWMHGRQRLPNMAGRKNSHCKIPNMEPEGDGCPLCHGRMKVWRTITYSPVCTECPHSPTGFHVVDTSMEEGPNNCFHCGAPMDRARLLEREGGE